MRFTHSAVVKIQRSVSCVGDRALIERTHVHPDEITTTKRLLSTIQIHKERFNKLFLDIVLKIHNNMNEKLYNYSN